MPDVSNRKRRPNGEFDDEDKKPKPATGGVALPYDDEPSDDSSPKHGHWPPEPGHTEKAQTAVEALMPMITKQIYWKRDQCERNLQPFYVFKELKEYNALPWHIREIKPSTGSVFDEEMDHTAFIETCHVIRDHPEILDDNGKTVARNILDNPDDRVAALALDSMDASKGDALRLSESDYAEVRRMAAESDVIPRNALGSMMWNDPDPDVRYAAFHAYGFRPRLDDDDLNRILGNEPDKRIRKEAFALRYGERGDVGIDAASTVYAEATGGENWEPGQEHSLSNLIKQQLGQYKAKEYVDYLMHPDDIHGNHRSSDERKNYIRFAIQDAVRSKTSRLGKRYEGVDDIFNRWFAYEHRFGFESYGNH